MVCGNVVVTHLEGSARLHAVADADGAASAGAADEKHRRYPASFLPGGMLVPFWVETFGRWGAEALDFLRDPVEIRIGNVDSLIANSDIVQEVVICEGIMQKESALTMLLRQNQCQAIVFTNTKRMAEQLAMTLGRRKE